MKLETQSCLTALRRFPWPSANETTAAKGEFSANHWPGSSPDPLTSGSIHLFRETRVAPGHSRWPPRCSRELNFREEKNRLIDDLCDLCAVFLATPVPHASRARRDAPIYKRAWEKDASRSDFLVAYLCRRDGHPSLLSGSSILPLKGRQHMERADVRDARPFGLGRRLCAAVVDRPTAPQPRPLTRLLGRRKIALPRHCSRPIPHHPAATPRTLATPWPFRYLSPVHRLIETRRVGRSVGRSDG